MTPFSHLSFLRKLTLFVLAATIFALCMTFVALTLYERSSFRQARHNELSLLASTLGQNSAASLAFNDQKTATDILAALQADPHIIAACLFDNSGRVFADYPHPRPRGYCYPPDSSSGAAHFTSNSLGWYQDVFLKGDKCGSILIVSDLKAFNRKISEYIQIESLVLVVAVLLTYLLSSRLLRIATDPILQLAQLAGRVSSEKDYSLRAPRAGADEIGILTLSFNDMLDGIQQRDAALQAAKDELEVRVHERTEALRREVGVRMHAERLSPRNAKCCAP
jgi:methyl-accepting chemotaxis protein